MAVSLITGGAGGIGREIALTFARHGYDVVIHYHAGRERAEALAAHIRETFGVRTAALCADLADPTSVCQLFDETERTLGAPEILINNAGV